MWGGGGGQQGEWRRGGVVTWEGWGRGVGGGVKWGRRGEGWL